MLQKVIYSLSDNDPSVCFFILSGLDTLREDVSYSSASDAREHRCAAARVLFEEFPVQEIFCFTQTFSGQQADCLEVVLKDSAQWGMAAAQKDHGENRTQRTLILDRRTNNASVSPERIANALTNILAKSTHLIAYRDLGNDINAQEVSKLMKDFTAALPYQKKVNDDGGILRFDGLDAANRIAYMQLDGRCASSTSCVDKNTSFSQKTVRRLFLSEFSQYVDDVEFRAPTLTL